MPELPEVETIRRDLARALLGKEIVAVQVLKPTMLHNPLVEFLATMQGNAFVAVNRLGKLLHFQLRYGHDLMLLHLKMTGQLIYSVAGGLITGGHPSADIKNLPNQHTRFIWTFDDNSQLFFNDLRTFGYVKLLPKTDWSVVQAQYGPEPLQPEFLLKKFKQSLSRRKISIKSALLNQKIVAGIGNIYADEICFLAGVLPTKPVPDLSEENLRALHRACKKIIKLAVEKRGTSFSDYVDGSGQKGGFYPYLKVYERAGLKCKSCIHATIKKVKHGGRGTHFCPHCQK